jgi:glycosyltransferase involved in cell wall biosynthesis
MRLSVIVPTLNGRDRLVATLDSLTAEAPAAEIVVVNGPSADGTTGMVRDREDVDRLVEVSDRNVNVARNAGIETATGDVIAFVGDDHDVSSGWADAVTDAVEDGASVVTGPCRRPVRGGTTSESAETREIAGREVTYFHGDNVAFDTATIQRLDGFDEYLETGGARDAAHRLAGLDIDVRWHADVATITDVEAVDGGREQTDWRWKYRALAYRLVKNYGLRPTTVFRTVKHALRDAGDAALGVLRGDGSPSAWLGNGRAVVGGSVTGVSDGMVARARDRADSRNPHGLSKRTDRAVAVYE